MKRVACFQVFAQRHKNPMQTRYPFLTASQIQAKLRQHWKNLDSFSQMSYSKTIITKNSFSPLNGSSKGVKSRSLSRKRSFSAMNANTSRLARAGEKSFIDPSIFDDFEIEINNEAKIKKTSPKRACEMDHKVPQVADADHTNEQGNLKIRDLNRLNKQRKSPRVKFSWDDDDDDDKSLVSTEFVTERRDQASGSNWKNDDENDDDDDDDERQNNVPQRGDQTFKSNWKDDAENDDDDEDDERLESRDILTQRGDQTSNWTSEEEEDASSQDDKSDLDSPRTAHKVQDNFGSMFEDTLESQEAEAFIGSRRLLSSAVIQGDKNFQSMFEEKDIFE